MSLSDEMLSLLHTRVAGNLDALSRESARMVVRARSLDAMFPLLTRGQCAEIVDSRTFTLRHGLRWIFIRSYN
jgi:hypothetical protein